MTVTSKKLPDWESFLDNPCWCRSAPGPSRCPPTRCCCLRQHFPLFGCEQCQLRRLQTDAAKLGHKIFLSNIQLIFNETTSIPCQLRHPSQPPVPSLYFRQSWKPRRTTPGAKFPPRYKRKSFALTGKEDYLEFEREVTSEKLLLWPRSSRGSRLVSGSWNQWWQKEKQKHFGQTHGLNSLGRGIYWKHTGVSCCPHPPRPLWIRKLTYGFNNNVVKTGIPLCVEFTFPSHPPFVPLHAEKWPISFQGASRWGSHIWYLLAVTITIEMEYSGIYPKWSDHLQSSAGASDRSLGRAAASIVGRIFHWPHSNIASSVLPTGFSTCQLKLNELRNISVRIWTNWFKVSGGCLPQNRFWQVLHWANAQNALMWISRVRYQ